MTSDAIAGIVDDLQRGQDGDDSGDAWHGPSLRKVLRGVDAATASARPIPGGHSIAALVAHLSAWQDVVVDRIEQGRPIDSPEAGDFPDVPEGDPTAWDATLRDLDRSHDRLVALVDGLDPARLVDPVAGKDYDIGHMLRGTVQHLAYHAGQIALIRKLAGIQG